MQFRVTRCRVADLVSLPGNADDGTLAAWTNGLESASLLRLLDTVSQCVDLSWACSSTRPIALNCRRIPPRRPRAASQPVDHLTTPLLQLPRDTLAHPHAPLEHLDNLVPLPLFARHLLPLALAPSTGVARPVGARFPSAGHLNRALRPALSPRRTRHPTRRSSPRPTPPRPLRAPSPPSRRAHLLLHLLAAPPPAAPAALAPSPRLAPRPLASPHRPQRPGPGPGAARRARRVGPLGRPEARRAALWARRRGRRDGEGRVVDAEDGQCGGGRGGLGGGGPARARGGGGDGAGGGAAGVGGVLSRLRRGLECCEYAALPPTRALMGLKTSCEGRWRGGARASWRRLGTAKHSRSDGKLPHAPYERRFLQAQLADTASRARFARLAPSRPRARTSILSFFATLPNYRGRRARAPLVPEDATRAVRLADGLDLFVRELEVRRGGGLAQGLNAGRLRRRASVGCHGDNEAGEKERRRRGRTPTIGAVTTGFENCHARATWAIETPRSLAIFSTLRTTRRHQPPHAE